MLAVFWDLEVKLFLMLTIKQHCIILNVAIRTSVSFVLLKDKRVLTFVSWSRTRISV